MLAKLLSSLRVFRTGSDSDWCALREALHVYKCLAKRGAADSVCCIRSFWSSPCGLHLLIPISTCIYPLQAYLPANHSNRLLANETTLTTHLITLLPIYGETFLLTDKSININLLIYLIASLYLHAASSISWCKAIAWQTKCTITDRCFGTCCCCCSMGNLILPIHLPYLILPNHLHFLSLTCLISPQLILQGPQRNYCLTFVSKR